MPDPESPDTNEPDPVRDQEPRVVPANPSKPPPPGADPAAEQAPTIERAPAEPPEDLDDGPLVA